MFGPPYRLRREARQRPPDIPLLEPLQGAVPELADPLPGHAQHAADLLQRVLAAAVEPEVEPQYLGIPRRQGPERPVDLLRQELVHCPPLGIALLVGDEAVDERALSVGIERGI